MLTNPRSAEVRSIARLSRKEARSETGLFLLEGPQAVREALTFRPELLESIFMTDEATYKHDDLVSLSGTRDQEVTGATDPVIKAMADTITPQGVVAVCRQFPVAVKHVFDGSPQLVVVLEEVRDPGNAGTVIRTADAAGASAVILSGRSVDLYNPKVVRSTTGSLFHMPIAISAELTDVVARAKASSSQVFAADMSGTSLRSDDVDLTAATTWVFGNEARGLDDEQRALADRVVSVPIYGSAESMNLATAASVCLYESAFAHHAIA